MVTDSNRNRIDCEEPLRCVENWGSFTIAFSVAMQRNLDYHFSHDEENTPGFIAHASRWRRRFALGDPIAPEEVHRQLIQEFIAKYPGTLFCNIGQSTARILADEGYRVNVMGVDVEIPLDGYSFGGGDKAAIRYASNWLRNHGFSVREVSHSDLSNTDVRDLSDRWIRTRTVKRREVGFINRPMQMPENPQTRWFCLFDANESLQAFVCFDPVFQSGRTTGYTAAIKRRLPTAPSCSELGILKCAIEAFQHESIQHLSLGLVPLVGHDQDFCRQNPLMTWGLRWARESKLVNRFIYNFQGHERFKRKFRGVRKPVYIAGRNIRDAFGLPALLKVMNVI